MIVRRLYALYLRVVAVLARPRAQRGSLVKAAASGAQVATVSQRSVPWHTNWLADARRLHTHPLPQTWLARPSTETVRQILRDPRWASAFDAPRVMRPPRLSNPLEARSLPEVSETAPTRPLTSPSPTPSANAEAEEAQRRLALMRDLVRRGLYNEGFAPKDAPDYYRPRASDAELPPEPPTS